MEIETSSQMDANGNNEQPQAGNQEAAGGQDSPGGKMFDEAYVRQLRAEAARYRTEAQTAKARVTEFEAAQMTETQKLQAQAKAAQDAADAAQVELRKARAETAIAREAGKQGLDPALVQRLIDVEYDDAGQPVNVTGAVAAVLKAYPQLKPQTPITVGVTNPGRAAKLTVEDVKKMTPEQIAGRRDEVNAVLAGG
ncbi:MAG: hypothetical protein WAU00_08080 [Caldilinea sp.]